MKRTVNGERRFCCLCLMNFLPVKLFPFLKLKNLIFMLNCRWAWSMIVQWKTLSQDSQYNVEVGNPCISIQKGRASWVLLPQRCCSHWDNIRDGLKASFRYFSQCTVPLYMDIKRFLWNFNSPTLPIFCGLQIAWLHYTMLPSHHFLSLGASLCSQR